MKEKLKSLQAKWRKRLKASGFKDIEDEKGRLIDHQTVFDFSQRLGFRSDFFESIRAYYSWASSMVWYGKFESALEKRIWLLHSQGRSTREIEDVVGLDWSTIARRIKKIRGYLREQDRENDAA